MLSQLNDLRDEAQNVDFPINGNEMEKAGAVIKLLISIGMLIKIFTGKNADKAIDHIISLIQGISTGTIIIQRVTDKT